MIATCFSVSVFRLSNVNKKELVEMQARLYLNLGLIAEQQGEAEAGVSYLNRAINLCKSMDIWEILYRSYNSLACLFQHQSNHARALENFDKAMNAAQRLQYKNQHICDLLLLKADRTIKNTANRREVEKKLRTVAAVNRFEEQLLNTPDFDLATKKSLYESLGDGCAGMKSYSKALEYYYLMLETAKNMGETGDQLRPCYVFLVPDLQGQTSSTVFAIKYFNEELKLNSNNPVEACKTTLNIAEVLEIKEADVEEILEVYRQALSLAQTAKDHRLEARALSSLVQVLRDNNRLSDSRKLEVELENLREKFGPLSSDSEGDEEDENTPDIGADICIEELSDVELEEGNENAVRTRKKCPTTKFRRNEKGEFPLHTACISGNLALVRKLLEQGHPVNVRDHNGWLPLHEACNFGYLEIVEELLNKGAAINDKGTDGCDGMTPLLDAASCGNLSVMNLLLQRGASPVMRTNRGETVLDCLVAWRKRYIRDEKRDLDPDTLNQYNDLVKTLGAALKKAGHKPESDKRSPSPPSYSASQPKSARRSTGSDFRDKITRRSGPSSSSLGNFDDQDLRQRKSHTNQDLVSRPSSSSLRRSIDDVTLVQDRNAAREYEDAMKALRRKPVLQPSSSSPTESKSALLDENELVDDWLIDDLAVNANRGVKRRRMHEFDGEPQRRPNRLAVTDHGGGRTMETERRNNFRPVSPVNMESDSNDSERNQQVEDVNDNENLAELSELLSSDEPTSQHRSQPLESTPVSRHGSSYQVPLSVFGVVRNPVPRQT
ncbi:tonsoku-like protein [Homalodisca vitripennis]|uniref:tonsoku-like protein n=1 Tax=Homalodisca vitripennis TaxID=197043 RepID=UPI001EEA248E|nr:tonsoku-like protein [Homalodisca vitripennis]